LSAALEKLSDEHFARLVSIHSQLSPESLTGDGEIPEPVWQERKVELDGALIALQAEHGLSNDDIDEAAVFTEDVRRNDLARRGQRPRVRL